MKLIAQGAEAKVYEHENKIIKLRLSKQYRIPEIDGKIIQQRIKREVKMLQKVQALGIPSPRFLEQKGAELHMEKIDGTSLRDFLDIENYKEALYRAGVIVARLHNADIIHGDLTTLNFIVGNGEIYVIDFGLSYVSRKDEDKAVDIYVFEKALRCRHTQEYLEALHDGYAAEGSSDVLERLKLVRLRGRKREESAVG